MPAAGICVHCAPMTASTTGELLAEVTLDPSTGVIDTRVRPGHEQAARTGAEAVQRFAAAYFG